MRPDTQKHLNKLTKITRAYIEATDEANEKLEQLKADFNNKRITSSVWTEKAEAIRESLNIKKVEAIEEIKALKKLYADEIQEWETPRGEDIDQEDIKLLTGIVTLTENEVMALKEKHRDNPLMNRALREYATKQGYYYPPDQPGERMKKAFEAITKAAGHAIENPSGYSGFQFREDRHIETLINTYGEDLGL
jgi:hypothetical protein